MLLIACFVGISHSEIYFHSDFECGETNISAKLRPGSRSIRLIENHRLAEWPEKGGKGMVEWNLPSAADSFVYAKRKGNVLKGVRGIRKPHDRGVEIRFGGLPEWTAYGSVLPPGSSGKILVNHPRLGGAFCARFSGDDTFSVLKTTPVKGPFPFYCNFLLRISEQLGDSRDVEIPMFFVSKKDACPGIALVKGKGDQGFHPRLVPVNKRTRNRVESLRRTPSVQPLVPGRSHAVQYLLEAAGDSLMRAVVSVDGQSRCTLTVHKLMHEEDSIYTLHIGRIDRRKSFEGEFYVDELIVSDRPISALAEQPQITFKDATLTAVSGTTLPGHVATQWQIHTHNAWLLPAYDSGEEIENLATLELPPFFLLDGKINNTLTLDAPARIPSSVFPDREYFARCRHKDHSGRWSPWSVPCAFKTPSTAEAVNPALVLQSPQIQKGHFARMGKKRAVTRIVAGEWYDFFLHISDPVGWEDLRFADVFMAAASEDRIIDYRNRGGAFDSITNYAMSISLNDPPSAYVKQTQGSEKFDYIFRKPGAYYSDENGLLKCNPLAGRVRARVRLASNALPGPWVLKAYAINNQGKVSMMFGRLFRVDAPEEKAAGNRPVPWKWIAGLGLIVLLGLNAGMGLYIRNRLGGASQISKKESLRPEEEEGDRAGPSSPYDANIKKAREFVAANFQNPITPRDIAKGIGVSPGWLSHFFRQGTGQPIVQYLNEVRVQYAKKLLEEGDLSVTEIAFQVGTNSLRNFNRIFLKIAKQTPKEYRESASQQKLS